MTDTGCTELICGHFLSPPLSGSLVELGFFLAFACAVMTCDSFGHLVPQVMNAGGNSLVYFALGVALTFGINKGVDLLHEKQHKNHTGRKRDEIKNFGIANLLIELVHNFVDGLSLGMAYLSSNIASGRTVTIAVAAHEIPQELSDGLLLLAAGLQPRRLLWLNFLVSLTCPLGVVVAFFLQTALARKAYAATAALAAGSFTTFAVFILGKQLFSTTWKLLTTGHSTGPLHFLKTIGPVVIAAWLGVALVHSVHEAAEGQLASDGDSFSVVTALQAFFQPTVYVHDEM
ncbi:Zinc transporter, putative [Perkinsus marinus ATCC 50983]|uniref:Zinc transporter, putative n=1 Tax=Perkinsus marinus (strain ATCC 50983 / TXsc) TaxID=423536 RepID=C5KLT6_PERM5|nr:Zinc transporter, putative [Perkinsus marinus ATCC 50983]EER14559.1 Zinc transporter, putative [Perkinsus marinus ATCC 50983]|eukprot:XP_002782764.1 Zinc transporter, putative [Perkinsus marinus ATCC 50983]